VDSFVISDISHIWSFVIQSVCYYKGKNRPTNGVAVCCSLVYPLVTPCLGPHVLTATFLRLC
jgi:hypothetical protein